MSVDTITRGCRLNFAESEVMKAAAPDGTVIVNSCAVTAEAVRQTRQAIRRARRERPDARIVVTGCAAQLEPESFAAMPEVDVVVGNGGKLSSPLVLSGGRQAEVEGRSREPMPFDYALRAPLRTSEKLVAGSLNFRPLPVAAGFRQRVRSFVAVQTGCDHRCTFCTIWQARGPSVTLPYSAVLDAVKRELDAGAKEIVFTGVDITSTAGGLGPLCQRLLRDAPQLHVGEADGEIDGDRRRLTRVERQAEREVSVRGARSLEEQGAAQGAERQAERVGIADLGPDPDAGAAERQIRSRSDEPDFRLPSWRLLEARRLHETPKLIQSRAGVEEEDGDGGSGEAADHAIRRCKIDARQLYGSGSVRSRLSTT